MKLKASWILLVLIQVANLSYCQYPITKKIGEDTVVIMTLKQGEQINKTFNKFGQDLGLTKDSLKIKRAQYDSLFNTISLVKDSFYDWKWKYEANRNTYYKRETEVEKDKKYDFAQKIILIAIIVLQFQSLK
jgi:hypothetical protein